MHFPAQCPGLRPAEAEVDDARLAPSADLGGWRGAARLRELRWLYDRRDLGEARRDLAAWLTSPDFSQEVGASGL